MLWNMARGAAVIFHDKTFRDFLTLAFHDDQHSLLTQKIFYWITGNQSHSLIPTLHRMPPLERGDEWTLGARGQNLD